jgi:hypothetical protein
MVMDLGYHQNKLIEMRQILETEHRLFDGTHDKKSPSFVKNRAHIEDALARIQKGGYGICIRCGYPIEEKRLDINPVARICIPCQL